ncbi:MAG: hypothetical protein ACLFSQ_03840 [Candidatus Zixiibacteriota bacterium]
MFLELILALIIALLMTAIFGIGIRRHRGASIIAIFFFIIFLGTWAVGLWARPFGPTVGQVSWLPFLVAGFFFALILTAIIPPSRFKTRTVFLEKQAEEDVNVILTFDFFFWIVLILLIAAIVIAYI